MWEGCPGAVRRLFDSCWEARLESEASPWRVVKGRQSLGLTPPQVIGKALKLWRKTMDVLFQEDAR